MTRLLPTLLVFATLALGACTGPVLSETDRPNIVLIYADDLGYGDVSSYGATEIETRAIDRLANEGLRFTRAYAPSATCTPSRYALLTGEYPWRAGARVAPGDAAALIQPSRTTLASVLQQAGYSTGIIGKWHLGLGPEGGPDWNREIRPGPLEIGFDYAFIIPATGDRVPTVYIENHRVVGLDSEDPIQVSYSEPVGNEPTGREHPKLLKMHPTHGHDKTIVNGISRIGYMSGGESARWVDEEMADEIGRRAVQFIEDKAEEPFFLFFSLHDPHVPRVPHPRYVGKSGMGPRGDAILQLDGNVRQITETLERLGLSENTIVIFTSDNGPVLNDGYADGAVELIGEHKPWGPLRGGKYSSFEAGNRVPFVVRWPGRVEAGGTSSALISQIDFISSFASLLNVQLPEGAAPDSYDVMAALLGRDTEGRDLLVTHSTGTVSLIEGLWKYIAPSDGPAVNRNVDIELGNSPQPQLYNLDDDIGETRNLADQHPEVVAQMAARLQEIRDQGRSRP